MQTLCGFQMITHIRVLTHMPSFYFCYKAFLLETIKYANEKWKMALRVYR